MAGKSNYLCKIDGVEGECPDVEYPGYVELLQWEWDAYMQGTAQTGGGKVMGKASLGTFSFSTLMSKASPKLRELCATGEFIDKAVLVARKQGLKSGKYEEFAKYTLERIVVSSSNISGFGEGGGMPTERYEFSFESLKMEYDTKTNGAGEGWMAASFDAKTNRVA